MERLTYNQLGQWSLIDEPLTKNAKDNIFHRMMKELTPHVHYAKLAHAQFSPNSPSHEIYGQFRDSNQPHEEGLVNFHVHSKQGHEPHVENILRRYAQHNPLPSKDPNPLHTVIGANNVKLWSKQDGGGQQYMGVAQIHQAHRNQLHSTNQPLQIWTPHEEKDSVREPSVTGTRKNGIMGSANSDAPVRSRKFMGQDPRHADPDLGARITRAGNLADENSARYVGEDGTRMLTSGVSQTGQQRMDTGKPVNGRDKLIEEIEHHLRRKEKRNKLDSPGSVVNSPTPDGIQ